MKYPMLLLMLLAFGCSREESLPTTTEPPSAQLLNFVDIEVKGVAYRCTTMYEPTFDDRQFGPGIILVVPRLATFTNGPSIGSIGKWVTIPRREVAGDSLRTVPALWRLNVDDQTIYLGRSQIIVFAEKDSGYQLCIVPTTTTDFSLEELKERVSEILLNLEASATEGKKTA